MTAIPNPVIERAKESLNGWPGHDFVALIPRDDLRELIRLAGSASVNGEVVAVMRDALLLARAGLNEVATTTYMGKGDVRWLITDKAVQAINVAIKALRGE